MADGSTTYGVNADGNFGDKMDEFAAKQDKLSDGFDKNREKASGFRGEVEGIAGSFLSVALALESVNSLMEDYARLQKEARSLALGSEDAAGQLAQIAQGSDLQRLLGMGREFAVSAGLPGEEGLTEAYQTINQLANAGMLESADTFAALRGSRLIGPVNPLVTSIASAQLSAPDAGTPTDVLATAMAAANTSTQNLDPVLQYIPRVAQASQATQLGFSFDEIAALTASQMAAAGTPEVGATNAAALLRGLGLNAGIAPGTPLQTAIDDVASRNLSANELSRMFGTEGLRGFSNATTAAGRQGFATALAATTAVTPETSEDFILNSAGAIAEVAPEFAAAQAQRQGEAARAAELSQSAAASARREGLRNQFIAGSTERYGTLGAFLSERFASDKFTLSEGGAGNVALMIVDAIQQQTSALLGSQPKAPAQVVNP